MWCCACIIFTQMQLRPFGLGLQVSFVPDEAVEIRSAAETIELVHVLVRPCVEGGEL